jgi:hypothetical protein
MRGDEVFHDRDRRIARRGHAEHELEGRIGELEGRAQRLFEEIVDAADRPHDAHRRQDAGRQLDRARPAPPSRNDDADEVEKEGDAAE